MKLMGKPKILWADDEIDLLKPHVLFLEEKGYEMVCCNNGLDAFEMVQEGYFDLVILDENMPGLSGLETLEKIKNTHPNLPIIMITKSEEEMIMEEAIGSKISDYLIKPVNPKQILLSLKKNLDNSKLVSAKTSSGYQQDFRSIGMELMDVNDLEGWQDLFRKMVAWSLKLQDSDDKGMLEIWDMQWTDANKQFSKFISREYEDWMTGGDAAPNLSHNLLKRNLIPSLKEGEKTTFLLVIDNLRYDQWLILQPLFEKYFRSEKEELYTSILPTTTQYARNALFAGLTPAEIERNFPDKWVADDEEGSRNLHEEFFLNKQLERGGFKGKTGYYKITNHQAGKKMVEQFSQMTQKDLVTVVYNFVDMLSHARTEMEVIRELADDEAAYRSITKSWFEHSPLFDLVRKIGEAGHRLVVTTDHGTVRGKEPSKVMGYRNTTTNLRYKQGKNLDYKSSEVLECKKPENFGLPTPYLSSKYIFALENYYFVYPNNYNHFVKFFKDTFQHGGVSLEEMMIPYIELVPR
ncbi:MAG: CheY-like chemotaxis protein [Luteibaculaceae bacterium]|jgi:CheY-like chemotaxis protein